MNVTRSRIHDYFFLTLLIATLYNVGQMLAPFAGAVLASLVCGVVFYPTYAALLRRYPRSSPTLLAIAMDTAVLTLIVTPFVLVVWAVIQESSTLGPVMKQWSLTLDQWRRGDVVISLPWIRHLRGLFGQMLGLRPSQVQSRVIAWVSQILGAISLWGAHAAEHAMSFVLDLLVMQFTLFFLFRDGKVFFRYLYDFVPIKSSNKEQLVTRFQDTVIGVARGWILTCFVQGAVATAGYLAVGIDGAVLLGVLTGAIGLLPVVGTFGIWAPVGMFLLANGAYWKAAFVMLWGAIVVVGLIDTIIRPYLVGKRAQLPLLALFFALLGGVEVWGAKGVIFDPIIVAMAPLLLDMYRERCLRPCEISPIWISIRDKQEALQA